MIDNREEKIAKEIRENWFKNHKSKLKKIEGLGEVLLWKQHGTVLYKVQYFMVSNMLFITGDLGDAAFNLTWRSTLESFRNVSLSYFFSKLTAYYGDKYDFNSKEAIKELKEHKALLVDEDEGGYDESEVEVFDELIKVADDCSTVGDWTFELNSEYIDDVLEIDPDAYEWIYDIGNVIPNRIIAYWVGLKMALEQIEE